MEENKQTGKKRKKGVVGKVIRGDVLQNPKVLKQIPLVLLVCLFCIALVYNRYRIEDLNRQRQAMEDEKSYLQQKQIELQKRYQETIKISQIAEMLDSTGIGITAGPPFELRIEN